MTTEPIETAFDQRIVAGRAVLITQVIFPRETPLYSIYLDAGEIDLTLDGSFTRMPTNDEIAAMIAASGESIDEVKTEWKLAVASDQTTLGLADYRAR